MNTAAVAAGSLIGLGVIIIVAELIPAPPRLDAAMARLEGAEQPVPTGVARRLAVRLAQRSRFPIPRDDLALLGISVERFAAQRIAFLALGLALPTMLNLLCMSADLAMAWALPVVAGVIVGIGFALIPDYATRAQARERRQEFRAALSTYLDMVALERAAGAGPSEALQAPADICSGWVFRRISEVLDQARRAGEPPWTGLAELGKRVGVNELTELADISEDAGTEGAKVLSTLTAKAQSMRTAALSDARAKANSRTSEMPVAIGMSVFGFLLLVCFPAVYRLMS
jgi:tight adherence protein C